MKVKLADRLKWAAKKTRELAGSMRHTALGLGGIGCIDAAVWINSVTWGLVATGVSLLVIQYLTEGGRR